MPLTNEQRREPITPVTAPAWWEVLGPEEFLAKHKKQCYAEFAAEQKAKEPTAWQIFATWWAGRWEAILDHWNVMWGFYAIATIFGCFMWLIIVFPSGDEIQCRDCQKGLTAKCLQAVSANSDPKDSDQVKQAALLRTLYRNATGKELLELK